MPNPLNTIRARLLDRRQSRATSEYQHLFSNADLLANRLARHLKWMLDQRDENQRHTTPPINPLPLLAREGDQQHETMFVFLDGTTMLGIIREIDRGGWIRLDRGNSETLINSAAIRFTYDPINRDPDARQRARELDSLDATNAPDASQPCCQHCTPTDRWHHEHGADAHEVGCDENGCK